jgi:hypothetical protein
MRTNHTNEHAKRSNDAYKAQQRAAAALSTLQ